MKAVMISIQPKWVEKISSGEKTIEVRKTRPKIDTPFKCYIYCTKTKEVVYTGKTFSWGKEVIGEFVCDNIDDFSQWEFDYFALLRHINLFAGTNHDYKFLDDYLKGQKKGYAWHISDLVIYDEPKELSEFSRECDYEKDCGDCPYLCVVNTPSCYETWCEVDEHIPLTRPPQSWCYVEEQEKI